MEERNNKVSPGVGYYITIMNNKWLIIFVTIIAAVGSVLYSLYGVEVQYKSTVNLVPPRSEGSAFENMMSNVGSALKKIGIKSLGGGGEGQTYEYMVILESRTVKDSIIEKYNLIEVYNIPKEKDSSNMAREAFNENHKIEYLETGNYLISAWDTDPERASKIANDIVYYADLLSTKIDRDEAIYNLNYLENRLMFIDSAYKKVSDSLQYFGDNYKVFSFEDQAKSYSDVISELKQQEFLTELSLDLSVEMYGENDYQTVKREKLLKSLRKQIADVQNKPGVAGGMTLQNAPEVAIKYANLYASFEAFTTIRAFLLPMIEKARLDVNRSTQNLFIVDRAQPAKKKDRPKRSLLVIGATLGAFVFIIFLVIIVRSFKNFLADVKEISVNANAKE